ncbi:hypothetical protein PUR71_33000 [Streptomyces sp. SP17BM10]|nr:hypothetical protein [Streptomyces sp. SP17BM10]MEE1787692.1 hypothetical protein [Streptomyces sp. SP17BM10]
MQRDGQPHPFAQPGIVVRRRGALPAVEFEQREQRPRAGLRRRPVLAAQPAEGAEQFATRRPWRQGDRVRHEPDRRTGALRMRREAHPKTSAVPSSGRTRPAASARTVPLPAPRGPTTP